MLIWCNVWRSEIASPRQTINNEWYASLLSYCDDVYWAENNQIDALYMNPPQSATTKMFKTFDDAHLYSLDVYFSAIAGQQRMEYSIAIPGSNAFLNKHKVI